MKDHPLRNLGWTASGDYTKFGEKMFGTSGAWMDGSVKKSVYARTRSDSTTTTVKSQAGIAIPADSISTSISFNDKSYTAGDFPAAANVDGDGNKVLNRKFYQFDNALDGPNGIDRFFYVNSDKKWNGEDWQVARMPFQGGPSQGDYNIHGFDGYQNIGCQNGFLPCGNFIIYFTI